MRYYAYGAHQICDGADERCTTGHCCTICGFAQAAYNEGLAYAREREQFGKAIIEIPAVYDMLATMKAKLDAGRALLYHCARCVDVYKALEDIARDHEAHTGGTSGDEEIYPSADAFTPLAKVSTPNMPTRTLTTQFPFTAVRASLWNTSASVFTAMHVSSLSTKVQHSCRL